MKTRNTAAKSQVYIQKLTLCNACLCQNRTLNSLGNLREIYKILCKNIDLNVTSDTYLCWECMNLLKKVQEFQEKVRKSQEVLYTLSINNEPCPSVSFSNLIISEILTLDTFENESENELSSKIEEQKCDTVKEITAQDVTEDYENKEEFIEESGEEENNEIFLENLHSYNEVTEIDYDDYDVEITDSKPNDDNDDEPKLITKTKFNKKQKVRNYPNERSQRYVMTYQSLKWQDAVQKHKIDNEQLQEWWEKEKNSDHFESLKNKCYICLQKLKMDEDIENHEQECHTATASHPYCCDICLVHFPSKTVLSAHIKKHYVMRVCNICAFECYSALHMRYHLRKAHRRLVMCTHCGDSFKNTRDFYVHLKSHSARSYYYCDQCGKRCRSLQLLEMHIKRNHEVQRCDDCDMTFKSHIQLSNHNKLKHEHAPSEQSFCVPCNKQFDNEFVYRRHLLSAAIHIRERGDNKEVACPVCLKVYSKNQTMMNHYRWVHSRDSRYKCEHCDKSFLNRTRYKDHVLFVHMGRERPKDKLCRFCNRAFTSNQALHHHILIHTGEKPHACHLCSQRFRQKTALHSHLKHVHRNTRTKDELYVVVPFDKSAEEDL